MANDCIPYFDDGDEITGHCTSAVTGKRFVKISAAAQIARTGLSTTADGGNVKIAPAAAGDAPLGVAQQDCASGSKVTVWCVGAGTVVPVTADGAVTAGDLISVGTAGKARTATAQTQSGSSPYAVTAGTVVVGLALDSALDGADVPVKVY